MFHVTIVNMKYFTTFLFLLYVQFAHLIFTLILFSFTKFRYQKKKQANAYDIPFQQVVCRLLVFEIIPRATRPFFHSSPGILDCERAHSSGDDCEKKGHHLLTNVNRQARKSLLQFQSSNESLKKLPYVYLRYLTSKKTSVQ